MSAKRAVTKTKPAVVLARPRALLHEVRNLILAAREQITQIVNVGLTALHWQVGERIRREILKAQRAEYGAEILSALSRQLEPEFGRGFGEENLRRMVQFAELFPHEKIVAALLRQLGWTHFVLLLPITARKITNGRKRSGQ
jgi:hypothetical protein